MTVSVSILETDVFTTVRSFFLTLISLPVIRTPVNRAAMPVGDFVALSPSGIKRLATNTDAFPTITTETILQPMEFSMRVDCYGATACDTAQLLGAVFRDELAVDAFSGSGYDIAPLYAGDPIQMPVVTGEDQYLERWTFEIYMQFNPVTTLSTTTTGTPAVPNLINALTTYGA